MGTKYATYKGFFAFCTERNAMSQDTNSKWLRRLVNQQITLKIKKGILPFIPVHIINAGTFTTK